MRQSKWTCQQERILRDALKDTAAAADALAVSKAVSYEEQRFYRSMAFAMRVLLDRTEDL